MENIDNFAKMYQAQAELNSRVGRHTGMLGSQIRNENNPEAYQEELFSMAGEWINDYLMAMSNEIEELRDCTFWKHWCQESQDGKRFMLHDLQNARVEVIDLLFFWMSLAQCVGLTVEDVYDIYSQKLSVNHKRQDDNYSMQNKNEDDNKEIGV